MSTLQQGYQGKNSSAEIARHARRAVPVRVQPRPDEIAIFAVERPSRRLRRVGHQPTGGKHPRHFAIDPSGNFLLVANRDTNNILVFRIDPQTGTLRRWPVPCGSRSRPASAAAGLE